MAFFLDNNKADQLLLGQGSNTALSERKARPVGKKKKRGKNPGGQLTAQDLISLFQSMPVPNRGFKNPNADKPHKMGQGMAWFDANNSPDQVAERQNRVDQNRQSFLNKSANQGAAAVDFMKQTKGYTDAQGNFVPPTLPREISSPYGTGSVTFTDKPTRGTMTDPLTGKTVFMDEYLPQQSLVQDSKYGAMPGQENGGALTQPRKQQSVMRAAQPQNDMAALFPGPTAPTPAGFSSQYNAPQVYDYLDPETGFPMQGTLGQKELAKRSAQGLFPGIVDQMSRLGGKASNAWQSVTDNLFGKSVEVSLAEPQNPVPQSSQSQSDTVVQAPGEQRPSSSRSGYGLQAQYQSPPVRQSNPFVGAPYGGKLNTRQEEILNLFAPIQDNRVVSGNTNEFHSVFPGTIGQLYWPLMQNADVDSFKQFFPEMDWTADYTDKSRQQIQDNFNALIKQNAIRVGPDGRYQLGPQIPLERGLQANPYAPPGGGSTDLSWLESLFNRAASAVKPAAQNPSMRAPDMMPPLSLDNLQQQLEFQSPQGLSDYFPSASPIFPQERPMVGAPSVIAALQQILAPQTEGLMTQMPAQAQQSRSAPVAPVAPISLQDLWGMQPAPTGIQNYGFPQSYFPQRQRLFY